MTAHHPQASMIGCQTVATPTVMPPTFQRPEPAGMIAMRLAIAEGRDPIAEFHSAVKNERYSVNQNPRPGICSLVHARPSSESLSAGQNARNAPRIAAEEEKIIFAINHGFCTWTEIRGATGFSEHQVSTRLMRMLEDGRLHRNKGKQAVYSITANNAAIAAE